MMQRYVWMILLIPAADGFLLPAQRQATTGTTTTATSTTTTLPMAGFGADAPKKKKELKPTKQWKQYTALTDSQRIRVAVRVVESTAPVPISKDHWFEVGAVKSKENAHTEAAVIRHRQLMADHARRMFPFKIMVKDKLEWGYSTEQGEDDTVEWLVAGKLGDMDNVDKLIGFQGLADPTGFYEATKEVKDTSVDAGFESIMAKRRN